MLEEKPTVIEEEPKNVEKHVEAQARVPIKEVEQDSICAII